MTPEGKDDEIYLNTSYGVTLGDKQWLKELPDEIAMAKMTSPLRVRGVGSIKHETAEYVIADLYFSGTDSQGNKVLACLRREIHIVDDLRAKLLIGNDIIDPEGIVVDVVNKSAFIGSCKIKIEIFARPRGEFIKKKIHVKSATLVPSHSNVILPTKFIDLPENRDFLFELITQANFTLFAHLVDHIMTGVLVRNEIDSLIQVSRKLKLGNVLEMDYEKCFQASIEPDFAMTIPKASKEYPSKEFLESLKEIPNSSRKTLNDTSAFFSRRETRLFNGVMVYGNDLKIQALSTLIVDFPEIWIDIGFVKIPQEEWMKILLRNDWQFKVNSKVKIYSLGVKDREVVDRTFDELHHQGRLKFIKNAIPFAYPVFVV